MKTIRYILALVVIATVHLLGRAGANAQTVSPVPSPTIITTAPYTISSPGYYQLGADLTVSNTSGNIITIATSNVTLDFAGHYISGPVNAATQLYGVASNEEGNLVIQNGTIAFCFCGIYLEGNGQTGSLNINQRVQNMLVSYCYTIGIVFQSASNSAILNNRVSFIGGGSSGSFGIDDGTGKGNQAIGNTVTNVTTANTGDFAYGIIGSGTLTASNNAVSNITNTGTPSYAFGIYNTAFAINNTIIDSYYGVAYATKYMGNLTSGCTTAFSQGTAVGSNN